MTIIPATYSVIHDQIAFASHQNPYDVKNAGYDCVILCASEHQNATPYRNYDITVINAPGNDSIPINMADVKTWSDAASSALSMLKSGKKVLCTCHAGLNRSAFTAVLLCVLFTGKSIEDVVEKARNVNPACLFNRDLFKILHGKGI